LSHFCNLVQFHHLPSTSPVHSTALLSFHETSYSQASLDPLWVKAMESELQALHATNTWTEVDLSPEKRLLAVNWCRKLSSKLMVLLKGIKHGWSLEVIHSENALISQKRFHL